MNNQVRPSVLRMAIDHYGEQHQKLKTIEELGELQTELAREQDNRTTPKKVITEIADVMLMIEQLVLIYGLDAVKAEFERKKNRLYRKILKEQEQKRNGNG